MALHFRDLPKSTMEREMPTTRGVGADLNVSMDLEIGRASNAQLLNRVVESFAWREISVHVKHRKTKRPLTILSNSNGIVFPGEMLAIMGPSGSGKTTLLNAISNRIAAAGASAEGQILVNGQYIGLRKLRQLSVYVEQEDALIGSLTVRETMHFAAGLSCSSVRSHAERKQKVEDLIAAFGLQEQSSQIVGTPLRKGLSGGQKKRLGVASRLVTDPKILFLDEPTSGLDSTLSFEVMNHIRKIAKRHNLLVIASIHQPSGATFRLFDHLCLLAKGKTCYFGPAATAHDYFAGIGFQIPAETNPAEFYLDLINTDLATPGDSAHARVDDVATKWPRSELARHLNGMQDAASAKIEEEVQTSERMALKAEGARPWDVLVVLLQRAWIKAFRDIVAYGIRIMMYLGLAILMGTVFLRFKPDQEYIMPYISAVFFSSAFMSFMSVAYVPAYLEDLHTFRQERANGLVGPLAFSAANFLVGLPFLFVISLLFSIVAYFLIDFHQSVFAFFKFVMWLFLDLVAAEALVVLISNIFPIFVVALAVTAFANGLWMCVGGFLVPMNILNPFWKFAFHYIDYQGYVFQGMMVNQFKEGIYNCASDGTGGYQCMYPSPLNAVGKIDGVSVLRNVAIGLGHEKEWVGLTIVIIFGYRLLSYLLLLLKRK